MLSQTEEIVFADQKDVFELLPQGTIKACTAPKPTCRDQVRRNGEDGASACGEILGIGNGKGIFLFCEEKHGYGTSGKVIQQIAVGATGFEKRGQKDPKHQGGKRREQNKKEEGPDENERARLKDGQQDPDTSQKEGDGTKTANVGEQSTPLRIEWCRGDPSVQVAEKEAMGAHTLIFCGSLAKILCLF